MPLLDIAPVFECFDVGQCENLEFIPGNAVIVAQQCPEFGP
jgi:hypothetical protein